MKVILKPDAMRQPNIPGALKAEKQYLVLAVEASAGKHYFRIECEGDATPALFEAELFDVVDPRIPSAWIIVKREGYPLKLLPASWTVDGFWERFFDDEASARREYEIVKREISDEHESITELTSLERTMLQLVASENWPELRLDQIRAVKRENTGAGRITYLKDALAQPLPDGIYAAQDSYIEMEGLPHGLSFAIEVTNGSLDCMKIVVIGSYYWDGVERPWRVA